MTLRVEPGSSFEWSLLILLAGGDKSSQSKDIELATKLAQNFRE